MSQQPESALLVPVPAAEPLVESWRTRLDPAAAWGVPAHVTTLYPFVPPQHINARLFSDLRAIFTSVAVFTFGLHTVNWFGDQVLWLEPKPDSGFRELTDVVFKQWPAFPPYGGKHEDIVPHLTIGQHAPLEELELAARRVVHGLPITTSAREVWLMTGSDAPNSWNVEAAFPLGEG